MALSLIFKPRKAKIGTLTLDASISESHESTNDVTTHPIESGALITDHVIKKPQTIRIEGIVSNTPIGFGLKQLTAFAGKTLPFPREAGPAQEAYETLMRLRESKTPITVVTALQEYDDMVIESLTFPRDAGSGDALRFTANLVQVQVVDIKTETLSVTGKKKGGQRRKNTASEKEHDRHKTALKAGTDWALSFFR
jgi:hypothetical protein